jgi:hypothetical protein
MGEGEETNGVRARGRRRPAFCLEWEKKGLGCLGIFVLPKKHLFQNPPHVAVYSSLFVEKKNHFFSNA